MVHYLFSPFTNLDDLCSTGDYFEFLKNYFESDVCWEIFGIGVGIAAVLAIVFYFIIGNKSYALSKRITWIAFLLITCLATFLSSEAYLVGHDGGDAETSTGIFADSYEFEADAVDAVNEAAERSGADMENQVNEWCVKADSFRSAVAQGEIHASEDSEWTIFKTIAFWNSIYSLLIYLGLSLFFKSVCKSRIKHATAIPF